MAIVYAIFTLEEALDVDATLDHVGCLQGLPGAHIEGSTSYQEIRAEGRDGYLVVVNDLAHDTDLMSLIIYDVVPTVDFLTAKQDAISAMLSELMQYAPLVGGPDQIQHHLSSRGGCADRAALVYSYPYDRARFNALWAQGRRRNLHAL